MAQQNEGGSIREKLTVGERLAKVRASARLGTSCATGWTNWGDKGDWENFNDWREWGKK